MDAARQSRRFRHQPLQSPTSVIRLFSLNCADESYLLSGTLKSYDIDTSGGYIALSYEWGEEEPKVEIKINGQWFLIRHNLWLFLSAIKSKQHSLSSLHFWIDAICINQQDVSERNAQVSMMASIYQRALTVLAWLGWPQGWDPKMTFQFIDWSCTAVDAEHDWEKADKSKSISRVWTDFDLLHMVLQMCTCRYWSRRWIVQEILLADNITIMCGDNELEWCSMSLFAQKLAQKLACWPVCNLPTVIRRLTKTMPFVVSHYRQEGVRRHTMCQLLLAFYATECEVLHDKVYSLRSLASDGSMIPVDYGCLPQNLLYRVILQGGWSDEQVLRALARTLCQIELPWRFRVGGKHRGPDKVSSFTIEEDFVLAQRILFCSIPVSFEEAGLTQHTGIKAASIPSSQKQDALDGESNLICHFEEAGLTQYTGIKVASIPSCQKQDALDGESNLICDFEETDSEVWSDEDAELRQKMDIETGAGNLKRFVTEDGSMGWSCSNAQAGDVLCDFVRGKKLVMRVVDRENGFRLIGTALLPMPPEAETTFFQSAQLAEASKRRQQEHLCFNDCLQPDVDDCSFANILLQVEKNIISKSLERLSKVVQSFEAGLRASSLNKADQSFQKRTMKVSLNVWDLIELTRRTDELISICYRFDERPQAGLHRRKRR